MRSYLIAAVAAAALLSTAPSVAFAQELEIGPGGVHVEPYHHGPYYHGRSVSRGHCEELRQACLHKEELGEEGMGNCRRYRHFCRGY
jgi:Spy/CpxP family protein refolding chaperone